MNLEEHRKFFTTHICYSDVNAFFSSLPLEYTYDSESIDIEFYENPKEELVEEIKNFLQERYSTPVADHNGNAVSDALPEPQFYATVEDVVDHILDTISNGMTYGMFGDDNSICGGGTYNGGDEIRTWEPGAEADELVITIKIPEAINFQGVEIHVDAVNFDTSADISIIFDDQVIPGFENTEDSEKYIKDICSSMEDEICVEINRINDDTRWNDLSVSINETLWLEDFTKAEGFYYYNFTYQYSCERYDGSYYHSTRSLSPWPFAVAPEEDGTDSN